MKTLALTLFLAVPALADHHGEKAALPAGLPAQLDTAKLEESGFTALFDGKTLDGWRKTGGTAEYEVKDGAIRGFGQNVKGNTFLRTNEVFGDFIYVFQFKFIDKDGNSGCMFRGIHKGDDPDGRVMGYQCEHDNWKNGARSWTAGIFDEARRGWLDPHKDAPEEVKAAFTEQGEKVFKWDDWNTIVIKCEGNHLQTWLNGEKRADYTDTNDEHTTLEGFIALQVHSGKSGDILWKNLYLKEL
ncbi:3-keto-disaccharide hydrolase [Roseibacillus ishigakijimensis]|nr:DUF1080 domain-containing protein [Roseibacillus ishigakijimensis]